MKQILESNSVHILRFDRGEEVIEGLKDFCQQEGIKAGTITALGATDEVELAHYDVDSKEYARQVFREKLEIANLMGNVSTFKKDVVVHAHGVFSGPNMKSVAGHVMRLNVAATCELTLHKLTGNIEREHSDDIGLNLMRD